MDSIESILDRLPDDHQRKRMQQLVIDCKQLILEDEDAFATFVEEHPLDSNAGVSQAAADHAVIALLYYFHNEDDNAVNRCFQRAFEVLEACNQLGQIDMLHEQIGMLYLEYQEYASGTVYLETAREFYENRGEDKYLGPVLANLGMSYRSLGDFARALPVLKQSIEISKRHKLVNLIYAYNNLASVYFRLMQYDKALEFYQLALQTSQEMDHDDLISSIYNNMANVYNDLGVLNQAMLHYKKSLESIKSQENLPTSSSTLSNIGIVCLREKRYEEAEMWFKRSIDLCEKHQLKRNQAKNYLEISKVYANRKDFEKAFDYVGRAEKFYREASAPYFIADVLRFRGRFLLMQNDYGAAESVFLESLEVARKHDFQSQIQLVCEEMVVLYEQTYNPEQLIKYQKLLLQGVRSFDEQEYDRKLANLQVVFEAEQKEREAEIYRLKTIELEKKNQEIFVQKQELERTLDQLRKSEISYKYLNQEIKEKLGFTIIGESQQMKRIIDLIQRVAATPTTSVLITGETGTGKELVARAIHEYSDRKGKNFCAVNVSSVPETLFESEFFGYKKHAFTGAKEDKAGWFEIANEGTLFLDEVGTWQSQLQSKFLRVLENRKIIPVGSDREIPVDFRLVSATNDNLQSMIEDGSFRADLYYRLSSFVVNISPLRERVEDIPVLLEFFVKHYSTLLNKRINKIEKQIESALMSYSFPGNVRELKNIVERAVIISNSSTLKLSCFNIPDSAQNDDIVTPLAVLEKDMVLKALKLTGFHQRNAAKLLSITPKSLERRMIKYEIKR